ncbi:hypothetical protein AKJ09_03411 [Labilithrix luteola]|uniref:PilZ domain-containing protein n=1 Tax=Labilithrix luteola TaxID=1391654 RepID=A0A0K1PTB5_9BACT|nr:PilZ domain-containing protein [Labilithrix luteola]AKU96747.1 hypothetical protein AKJ09_03411 [Labilithrix luteola]
MNTASDRRAPGAMRIPFDAMVEVGGSLGPSFEAQAVNLSEEGMQLRTAYLPEVGQPIRCRFDAGQGVSVLAAGEVLWNEDHGEGGEFGVRFTNLDGQSTVALHRILGMAEEGVLPKAPQGRKIRLHIDGLASPMRARVRASQGTSVTAFSELGFLQVGKGLDIEDAGSGARRPAMIDGVSVEVPNESRVPQLVVTLRYDDEAAEAEARSIGEAPTMVARHEAEEAHDDEMSASEHDDAQAEGDEEESEEVAMADAGHAEQSAHSTSEAVDAAGEHDVEVEESNKLKGTLVRTASKITPAVEMWAKRAKTTFALLAARAAKKSGGKGDDVAIPMRRMTAPPPGGGLHTAGRKVVRYESEEKKMEEPTKAESPLKITKKKAAVAGAGIVAIALAAFALHKPAPAAVATAPVESAAPVAELPAAPASASAPAPAPAPMPVQAANDPLMQASAAAFGQRVNDEPSFDAPKKKPGKVTPFGNGPVGSGNVMRIKMDGAIEKIHGASQPSGFTVVIPGRLSLEAAAPLAAKDSRIAAIRMSNEPSGAELSVTFKDGVPNYQVRAKGDSLELVLAKAGQAGEKAPEAHVTPTKKKSKKHR